MELRASEIGLSPRRMATGSSSVRVGSYTEKDPQLDAVNYNVLSYGKPENTLWSWPVSHQKLLVIDELLINGIITEQ